MDKTTMQITRESIEAIRPHGANDYRLKTFIDVYDYYLNRHEADDLVFEAIVYGEGYAAATGLKGIAELEGTVFGPRRQAVEMDDNPIIDCHTEYTVFVANKECNGGEPVVGSISGIDMIQMVADAVQNHPNEPISSRIYPILFMPEDMGSEEPDVIIIHVSSKYRIKAHEEGATPGMVNDTERLIVCGKDPSHRENEVALLEAFHIPTIPYVDSVVRS